MDTTLNTAIKYCYDIFAYVHDDYFVEFVDAQSIPPFVCCMPERMNNETHEESKLIVGTLLYLFRHYRFVTATHDGEYNCYLIRFHGRRPDEFTASFDRRNGQNQQLFTASNE